MLQTFGIFYSEPVVVLQDMLGFRTAHTEPFQLGSGLDGFVLFIRQGWHFFTTRECFAYLTRIH